MEWDPSVQVAFFSFLGVIVTTLGAVLVNRWRKRPESPRTQIGEVVMATMDSRVLREVNESVRDLTGTVRDLTDAINKQTVATSQMVAVGDKTAGELRGTYHEMREMRGELRQLGERLQKR